MDWPHPTGARPRGAAPPDGALIWFEDDDGALHGPRVTFDPDTGRPKMVVHYVHGRRDGSCIAWWENGEVRTRGLFVDDRPDGRFESFYPSGSKLQEWAYGPAGISGPMRTWYEHGQLARVSNWVDDDEIGRVEVFFEDGAPSTDYEAKNGLPHGHWRSWYPNGALQEESDWRDGLRHGPYRSYYPFGPLWVEGTYDRGALEGEWTYWYVNGILEARGRFVGGARDGRWAFYWQTGQPMRFGDYAAGEPVGAHEVFDFFGAMTHEGPAERAAQARADEHPYLKLFRGPSPLRDSAHPERQTGELTPHVHAHPAVMVCADKPEEFR